MKDRLIIYVHGQGGNVGEADFYRPFFPDSEVYGLEYSAATPWEAAEEFREKLLPLMEGRRDVRLIGVSLGAFFTMGSGLGDRFSKAWLISPIVDMEGLIMDMIGWAGTTERELERLGTIPVSFGDPLSWEYLSYVRTHPIAWSVPTHILYGSRDRLQRRENVQCFADAHGAELTVLEGAEHWIHTDRDIAFLKEWLEARL